MEEYIKNIDLDLISNQTLAFIGDSIYEVYIRTYLASKNNIKTGLLHKETIKFVSGKSQSIIIENIMDKLTDKEIEIYKRGRNTNINNVSKNVDVVSYKKATGFEALIGYLYLSNDIKRLEEIIEMSIKFVEN